MLGAIIGDIVGSRFEFNNTDNYNFELFTEESTFTDDTICTIAIAHAIYYLRTTKNLSGLENEMQTYYPMFMIGNYYAGVFDETCQGTVPICLKIIISSNSFEDAIRKAISWGGDSDTIGAIVGSMAAAIYEIPKEIVDHVFNLLPTDMLDVIGNFYHKLNNK